MVVCVGTCAPAAPKRKFSLMSDPSLYIKLLGMNIGVHECGAGGAVGTGGNVYHVWEGLG